MRENGPVLSRVVDPPGTKGGPRAGNFPGPPKNTFCPGSWLHPGQKGPPYICPFFLRLPPTLGHSSVVDFPRRRCPPSRADHLPGFASRRRTRSWGSEAQSRPATTSPTSSVERHCRISTPAILHYSILYFRPSVSTTLPP